MPLHAPSSLSRTRFSARSILLHVLSIAAIIGTFVALSRNPGVPDAVAYEATAALETGDVDRFLSLGWNEELRMLNLHSDNVHAYLNDCIWKWDKPAYKIERIGDGNGSEIYYRLFPAIADNTHNFHYPVYITVMLTPARFGGQKYRLGVGETLSQLATCLPSQDGMQRSTSDKIKLFWALANKHDIWGLWKPTSGYTFSRKHSRVITNRLRHLHPH